MSSWKKAAKSHQRIHRERSQPESRKSLGLLEKKKDYIVRAKDYHNKQDALKILRKRALNKNPDEFYFHMINSKIEDGEHHEKEKEDDHTPEQIKLMQTQDLKYINMKRTIETNKIKRLQGELHLIDAANETQNTHKFFVDSKREMKKFDLAKRLDTDARLLGRRTNRPRISELEKMKLPDIDDETMNNLDNLRHASYRELRKRIDREKELSVIQQKMEIKRALLSKGLQEPERIAPGTKNSAPVYKWKYERKK